MCISDHDPTRKVFGSMLSSFGEAFIFTPTEAAHRSSSHLERARQIFLKYTHHYDDLVTHQVLGLVTHILWKELKRCNYPRPDALNDIQYCKSAYAVAQMIANMLDAEQSAEDSPEKKFWNQFALRLKKMRNMEHPSLSLDGILGFLWEKVGMVVTDALDSEYIRNRMDEWLDDILQDELDD